MKNSGTWGGSEWTSWMEGDAPRCQGHRAPFAHAWAVEVEEQAERKMRDLQIRDELLSVKRKQLLHGLHFDNDLFLHDEITLVGGRYSNAVVIDRKNDLTLERQPELRECLAQAFLVRTLDETRADRCMNIDCRADDFVGDLVWRHLLAASVPFVHLCALGSEPRLQPEGRACR